MPQAAAAENSFLNGYTHFGSIVSPDGIDLWTFTATNGDSIVIRSGDATVGPNTFHPKLRLYGPGGTLLASDTVNQEVHEVAVKATNSGLFSVEVFHGTVVGDYIITLDKTPGAIAVAPGDEGGILTNGWSHTGAIPKGDLDVWTFAAALGERVVLRVGTMTNFNTFSPVTRVIGPDGATVAAPTANSRGYEFDVLVTNGGVFHVLVAGSEGSGEYRLTLAKIPGEYSVAPGDEGGTMTNGFVHTGFINDGDLDLWSFNLCAGDSFGLWLAELPGGTNFEPALRLYAPNGSVTTSATNISTALLSGTAAISGRYTLLVSDKRTTLSGFAPYELVGTNIYSGLSFCPPTRQGTNLILQLVGGQPGSNCVLLSATNIALPQELWAPLQTNTFGVYGSCLATNYLDPAKAQQFFRLNLR